MDVKVLSLLHFPDGMSEEETVVAGYLKKYLKETRGSNLCMFLKFCTDTHEYTVTNINVTFTGQYPCPHCAGQYPYPYVNVCQRILELPTTYTSYEDFCAQFDLLMDRVAAMSLGMQEDI
jgi:hypothetical protein